MLLRVLLCSGSGEGVPGQPLSSQELHACSMLGGRRARVSPASGLWTQGLLLTVGTAQPRAGFSCGPAAALPCAVDTAGWSAIGRE